jgi:hypothetical protein
MEFSRSGREISQIKDRDAKFPIKIFSQNLIAKCLVKRPIKGRVLWEEGDAYVG